MLEQIHQQHDSVIVVKVDVNQHPQFSQKKGVRSIPDTRIYYNSREVNRFVGFRSQADILPMLRPYLNRTIASKSPPIVEAMTGKLRRSMNKREDQLHNTTSHTHTSGSVEKTSIPRNTKPVQPNIQRMDKEWLPPGVKRIGPAKE